MPTCICTAPQQDRLHTYAEPPTGEVKFERIGTGAYLRDLLRCRTCGHVVSQHGMDLSALYSKEYVDSNYGDLDGIKRTFDRINGLSSDKSDNVGRTRRIVEWAGPSARRRTILDVGSGLCVFLHRMKEAGWDGTALDPDPRSIQHARENVGVRGVCGDFMKLEDLGQFDAISFNKVLEHLEDPIAMLARARRFLRQDGFVYVELPDADAWSEGPGREEFFIDHFHVFSMASIVLLAERAGFHVATIERLREPSTKFTLRAFVRPSPSHD